MPSFFPGAALLRLCATTLGLIATGRLAAAADDPAPVPVFFTGETLTRATLSPDGRFVAVAITEGEATRIEVTPIDEPDRRHIVHLGAPPNPRVTTFAWAGDGTLVFSTEDWVIAAVRSGQPVPEKLADPISLESQFNAPLLEGREAGANVFNDFTQSYRLPRMPRLIGADPTDPHAVLIETVSGDSIANADLRTHRIDTRSGEVTSIDWHRIVHSDTSMLSDSAGRIRLVTERVGDAFVCRVRIESNGKLGNWRRIEDQLPADWGARFAYARSAAHRERSVPLTWDGSGNRLVFAAMQDEAGWALWETDLGSAEPPQLLLSHAGADTVWPADYGPRRRYGRQEQRAREVVPAMQMTDFAAHVFPLLSVPSAATADNHILIDGPSPASAVWTTGEWQELTTSLARDFPGRQAIVLGWSADRLRWLLRLESADRPARLFVHELPQQRWTEYYRTARDRPWGQRNLVETAWLDSTDGSFRLRLTRPHAPRITQPPLVCLFSAEPWEHPARSFNPAAHTFADAGAWVLEIDPPLRISDHSLPVPPDQRTARRVTAALTWLAAERDVRPGKLAAVGHGFGGWLALRTASLLPGRFQAVVALNHGNRLEEYFYGPEFETRGLRSEDNTDESVVTAMALMEGLKAQRVQLGIPADPLAGGFSARGVPDTWGDGSNDEREPAVDTLSAMVTRRVMTGGRSMRELKSEPMPPLLLQQSLHGLPDEVFDHSVAADAASLPDQVLLGVEEFDPYLRDNPSGRLARALERHDKEVERWLMPESTWSRSLEERPDVWHHVATFLAANLYHYDVQFGPTQRVP